MTHRPNSSAEPGRSGAGSLQRLEANLDRLEGDKQLVLELALRRFEGPHWKHFACVLAEYGYQVMQTWIWNGEAFAQCRKKGRPIRRTIAQLGQDDVVGLAGETVAKAIQEFRDKVLIPGRWDPSKGASLRTFFVGQCVLQFPSIYRAFESEQDLPPVGALESDFLRTERPSPDVQVEVSRWLKRTPDRSSALILGAVGLEYTHAEIGEMMGISARAVESRFHRARKNAA